MKKVGPWRVNERRAIFDNPWISLIDHAVTHPDGAAGEYGVVRFKNLAIGVLPFDNKGMVTLVGQHRFPHDKYSWELPEGGGPLDCPALQSAERELEEETGLRADGWAEMIRCDLSNSVTDEKAVCFYAWGLSQGAAAPESSEKLSLKRVSFKSLLEMVMQGQVSDSLTIIMTLTACVQALRGSAPEPISGHVLAALRGEE